jgi:FixJ family two-component response regulator
VIVLGEETDVRAAVDAMREGAADFIEKQHMDLAIPRRVAYLLDRTH